MIDVQAFCIKQIGNASAAIMSIPQAPSDIICCQRIIIASDSLFLALSVAVLTKDFAIPVLINSKLTSNFADCLNVTNKDLSFALIVDDLLWCRMKLFTRSTSSYSREDNSKIRSQTIGSFKGERSNST